MKFPRVTLLPSAQGAHGPPAGEKLGAPGNPRTGTGWVDLAGTPPCHLYTTEAPPPATMVQIRPLGFSKVSFKLAPLLASRSAM